MRQLSITDTVYSDALPERYSSSIRSNSKYCRRMPSSKQKSNALVGSVLEYSHRMTSGSYSFSMASGVRFSPEEPDILPVSPLMPMNS